MLNHLKSEQKKNRAGNTSAKWPLRLRSSIIVFNIELPIKSRETVFAKNSNCVSSFFGYRRNRNASNFFRGIFKKLEQSFSPRQPQEFNQFSRLFSVTESGVYPFEHRINFEIETFRDSFGTRTLCGKKTSVVSISDSSFERAIVREFHLKIDPMEFHANFQLS